MWLTFYCHIKDNKLTEEDFTAKLEKTLNSPSQPNLVNFLKVCISDMLQWQTLVYSHDKLQCNADACSGFDGGLDDLLIALK